MQIIVNIDDGCGAAVRFTANGIKSLADLCDAHGAPVDFSCRAASCSTCRVRVLSGAELIDNANPLELELLAALGNPHDIRFCCTATLRSNATGELNLHALGPAF